VVSFPSGQLLLDILLLGQASVELEDCALEPDSHLLVLLESDFELVDFELIGRTLLLHRDRQTLDLRVFLDAHLLHIAGELVQIGLVKAVNASDFSLPLSVLSFLLLLLSAHFVEVVALFSCESVMQAFKLLLEVSLLSSESLVSPGELRGVPLAQIVDLATVAVFLSSQLISVHRVEAGVLVGARSQLLIRALLIIGELLVPLVLTLHGSVAQVSDLRILAVDLTVMPLILVVLLLKVGLLRLCGLPLLLLNLLHELLDFSLQAVLELLLHLGVLLHLLCCQRQSGLKLLSGGLAITNELLVLSDILLKVVEDLQFLIEGDQRVQFVLKLDFLLFEGELELIFLALVEHRLSEAARRDSRDSLSDSLLGTSAGSGSFR